MNILLTGGLGYIGSHTAVVLSEAGHDIVLLDNFSNSRRAVLKNLEKILGKNLHFIEGDIRDTELVVSVLQNLGIDAVIHFAGHKSVGESSEKPIKYYSNNVQGSISLLKAMKLANVKTLIFSSSATVYGNPEYLPIDEVHSLGATNAYGRSKLHIEEMLKDVANSNSEWKIICLRYFNPTGAHKSGLIGEDPNGVPNNLMPYIAQVASNLLPHLNVYGNDYPTIDGTGVRDYIHVMDLAEGHLAALKYADTHPGWDVFNLGTGRGVSVFELLREYQSVSGRNIAYVIRPRRTGDIASCYANIDKAKERLGWVTKYGTADMCKSSWKWQFNQEA